MQREVSAWFKKKKSFGVDKVSDKVWERSRTEGKGQWGALSGRISLYTGIAIEDRREKKATAKDIEKSVNRSKNRKKNTSFC